MLKLFYLIVAISFMAPSSLWAKVNIFACEPEWAALTKEIGKSKVKVFSATNAFQDPHYIQARPSLIAKIRKADLLVCSGASLESGWLPLLLNHGSKQIQPNQIGNIMSDHYVETIEKPEKLDRAHGDIHFEGNPHTHLNPYNILIIAKEISARLSNLDSENSDFYKNNETDFANRWNSAILNWQKKAKALQGLKVISYHKSFSYFFAWLNIDNVASLEAKPGIPPTIKHLEKILKIVKQDNVKLTVLSPYDPLDSAKWMQKQTDLKYIILPYTIGGNSEVIDLFSLYDNSIELLLKK
ncbi:MAG: zinc ABC transporter substrate-binding protein [Rickettsiales bacterium]|nr:zinc ABC transporter substrate-binding protein [Rickettsiales bacterium]